MKTLLYILPILVIVSFSDGAYGQNSRKERRQAKELAESAKIDSLLSVRRYKFVAQNVYSAVMTRNTTLSSRYDITVTPDSLISYLPYVGKLYSPNTDNESPLIFTTTDFTYSAEPSKKESTEVTIEAKPKKSSSTYKIYITVFPNGSGFLQILSSDKTSISFSGYVTEAGE